METAHPLLKKVHVARNGQIIGSYEYENLGDLIESGSLQATDHYFDERQSQWVLLSAWTPVPSLPNLPPPPSLEPESDEDDEPQQKYRRQLPPGRARKTGKKPSLKKGKESLILAGWVACLFALGIAAGLWAWSVSLRDQLASNEEKIRNLETTVDALRKQNDLMSEITPAGHVRGIITYETTSNQIAIMSGATVGLYKRADVETALSRTKALPGTIGNSEDFDQAIEKLKAVINSPVEITLTDSRGRLDVNVPGSGDYVLVASAAKTNSNGGTDRYLWLIGFRDQQQPSSLILLNEKNAISLRNPQFSISTLQPLAIDQSRQ